MGVPRISYYIEPSRYNFEVSNLFLIPSIMISRDSIHMYCELIDMDLNTPKVLTFSEISQQRKYNDLLGYLIV